MADDPIDPTQLGTPTGPAPDLGQAPTATPVLSGSPGSKAASGPPRPGRPALLDFISEMIKPSMQASAPGQIARPVSRVDSFENFLGNFVSALGSGMAASGHGPGSFGRGFGGAIQGSEQLAQQQYGQQQQAQAAQVQQQQEQAKTAQVQKQTELAGQMGTVNIPGLGPVTAPVNQLGNILKGSAAAAVGNEGKAAIEKMKEGSPLQQAQAAHMEASSDLAKAHSDTIMNPNNPTFKQKEREIQAKLAIAQQNVKLRQMGIDLRAGDMSNKIYQPAMDADVRLATMRDNRTEAMKGDQQAMLSLLTNHLGMTMGLQKGARITKDILKEAQDSAPWLQKVQAKFDNDGYLSGATLTPGQMNQMVGLAESLRPMAWQKARSQTRAIGVDHEPQPLPGLERAPEGPPIGANAPSASTATTGSIRFQSRGRVYNIPAARKKEFLSENPAAIQMK